MYNNILKEISLDYDKKRYRNERDKDRRIKEVYRQLPRVKEIDDKISKIGLEMSKSIIMNPDINNIEEIKDRIEELKIEKAYLLTESNIPLDYMDMKYECESCKDTGYLDTGSKCSCLEQKLVSRAYKMSNLENILKKENFTSFDMNIFSEEVFEDEGISPRQNMMDIMVVVEKFLENFDKDNGENLLFYGTTGLGKTFLSNCIAKSLLDNNKIVIYQTAFTILDILENKRFGKGDARLSQYQYDLLLDSDLLIIDDLGTELSNAFTNSEIFNVIDTRLIKDKKTIISTNLNPKEISEIYTDRVFSRIFQNFVPLKFFGKDLRWEN